MIFRLRAFTVAVVLFAGCAPVPLPEIAQPAKVTYDVRTLDLPSGMRVIIETQPAQPIATVVAMVGAGAAEDPPDKAGLAHFVEHLSYRSKHDGKTRLSNQLAFAGTGEWNGETALDTTTFYDEGPAEALESLLAIEGQRLAHPVAWVDDASFDVERAVVINELTTRDERGQVPPLLRELFGALFPAGHPYARGTGGTPASMASITRDDVDAFVARYYRPQNITLVVSSPLRAVEVGTMLDRVFPQTFLATTSAAPSHDSAGEPPRLPDGDVIRHLQAPVEHPVVLVGWTLPPSGSLPRTTSDFLDGFLGTGPFWAEGAKSVNTKVIRGDLASVLLVAVELKDDADPDKVAAVIQGKLDKLWFEGTLTYQYFVDQVFPRIRRAAMVERELEVESPVRRSMLRAEDGHFRQEGTAFAHESANIGKLSREQIYELGKKYVTKERARLVAVKPQAQASSAPGAGSTPFAEDDSVHAVYPADVVRAMIHPPLVENVQTLSLDSGLEVTLVPRDTGGVVTVTIGVPGGRLTARPPGVGPMIDNVHWDKSYGSPVMIGAQATEHAGDDVTWITYQGAGPNLPNLLSMAAERLDTQRFSEDSFHYLLNKSAAEVAKLEARPEERFTHRFERTLLGDLAVAVEPSVAEMQTLREGDVNRWLEKVFTPAHARVVIVGDLNPKAAKPEIEKWLGRWRRGGGAADEDAALPARASGAKLPWVLQEKPVAPQAELKLACMVPLQDSRDALAVELLGHELERDINELARGALGGTYGFQVHTRVGRNTARLVLDGKVDNAHFARVLAHERAAWNGLGTHPVTDEQLNRARWNWARDYDVRFATSAALAQEIVRMQLSGHRAEEMAKVRDLAMSITADDLARVAKLCRERAAGGVLGEKQVLGTTRNFVGDAEMSDASVSAPVSR